MGATGAGKSTFINYLVGKEVAKVGKTLSSCTASLQDIYVDADQYSRLNKGRIVFLDTPGFDNSFGDGDIDILTKIVEWLESSYKDKKVVLGGVVYLHDISSNHSIATAQRNLEMFQYLCGQEALGRVIIGTTKWRRIDEKTGDANYKELQEVHWKTLTAKGARVRRFNDSTESAWSFIDVLNTNVKYRKNRPGTQKEAVVDNKALIYLSRKLRKYLCFP
ncbi:hypothetical protein CPB84DRAFT_132858 [Gymnopilus junonius]|uniref:G domain-containing protein n=1 Tax=Gymnopilus junonius TaxID=109634 RepID=A0A9P5NHL0_GYMJU|nr:hypothetical protein CPB84DRAFT_132858 [Gymnopilus junonius]